MKTFLFVCYFSLAAMSGNAQFRQPVRQSQSYFVATRATQVQSRETLIPGLLADQTQNYKTTTVVPTDQYLINSKPTGHMTWIGSVTSQSFNNGKFGTFYYWDMQGNLQGTRGFIDLAGKNKRGFKLLFPWR